MTVKEYNVKCNEQKTNSFKISERIPIYGCCIPTEPRSIVKIDDTFSLRSRLCIRIHIMYESERRIANQSNNLITNKLLVVHSFLC